MLFNSIEFLVFFPIVLLIYYVIPKRYSRIWLLFASYFFYMSWNVKYGFLILLSTLITFFCALLIDRYRSKKAIFLTLGIFSNLSILFFFKYFNFGIDIINLIARIFHINTRLELWNLVLPVGISFYSLQALGYLIDVYRDEIKAEYRFVNYALFVSFFPQLVAGPIERSKNLLSQLEIRRDFSWDNLYRGLLLMLWGYFLKLVLADRIAIYVDAVWGDLDSYEGIYLILALLLFAFQIYCDFYGYSLIAMGAAGILGIKLMDNFSAPFLSESTAVFWRNWHVSLMTWFRDYVYIPLGGSRRGRIRKYVNNFIVFAISGLWHGARGSYIAWGVINGLFVISGNITKEMRERILRLFHLSANNLFIKVCKVVFTFILFDISLIFFRSVGFRQVAHFLSRLKTGYGYNVLLDGRLFVCGLAPVDYIVLILGIVLLLICDMCKKKGIVISEIILKKCGTIGLSFILIVSAIIILTIGMWGPAYDSASFIYFQF